MPVPVFVVFLQSLQAVVSALSLFPSMFINSLTILLFDAIWLTAVGVIK